MAEVRPGVVSVVAGLVVAGLLIGGVARPALAEPLSTLEPAGDDARLIADLFWWMAAVSGVVWIGAVAVLVHCFRANRSVTPAATRRRLVTGGGVLLPTVLLAVLLGAALPRVAPLVDAAPPSDALVVHVVGEQWWWRVRYVDAGGRVAELANELRLPVGRTTYLTLTSDNVIHAFWIPTLAGKVDMVPGRTTYLTLEPRRTGSFRGICAGYCGTSHARRAFDVEVIEDSAFDDWVRTQSLPPT